MIATMSPAAYNYEETMSTLRYANRAKNIKNRPKINEDPKDALMRLYTLQVQQLKEALLLKMSGKTFTESHPMIRSISGENVAAFDEDDEDYDQTSIEDRIKSIESKLLCGGKDFKTHVEDQGIVITNVVI